MMDRPEALPSLVPLVTKEEQLSWAEKIKTHVPYCVTMYNNLVQHGRGHLSHGTFYVLHDCPSSYAVVCTMKIEPTKPHVGIFCPKEEVDQLIQVLGSASIINWQQPGIVFRLIPSYLAGPLQQLAERNGVQTNRVPSMAFIYDPHLNTEPLRVCRGFRLCRLGRAGIRHLLKNSKNDRGVHLELMYTMAQQVPYLGVYQDPAVTQDTTVDELNLPVAGDEEIPVAWGCSKPTGDVGRVMIEKEFRGYGFGILLGMALARRQAALLGLIPHGYVEVENVASRAMMSKMAGWSYTHDAFTIFGIAHKGTQRKNIQQEDYWPLRGRL